MILRWLTGFYKAILGLYPRGFRSEFSDEMGEVFEQAVQDASLRSPLALINLCLRELISLPSALLRARKPIAINSLQPEPVLSNQNLSFDWSWKELLLTLLVFLLPANILLSDQFSSHPEPLSWLAVCLFLVLMLVIGWLGGFPLWSAPYIGIILVIAGYLVVFEWVVGLAAPALIAGFSPGRWDHSTYLLLQVASKGLFWLMLFCLTLLVVILLSLIKRFQPLAARVRQDWSMVSYILYGEAIFGLYFLYSSQGFDPNFAFASLLCLLAGVWFFLRSRAHGQRLLALVSCLTLAVALAAMDQWLQAFSAWPAWSELRSAGVTRLLQVWFWVVSALLLPGLLSRRFLRRSQAAR
jgi:hypothetical protein